MPSEQIYTAVVRFTLSKIAKIQKNIMFFRKKFIFWIVAQDKRHEKTAPKARFLY